MRDVVRRNSLCRSIIAGTIAVVAIAHDASAQGPQPISANRPGFIEATATLGRGQLQAEFSASVDHFGASTRTWSEPFHLRAGVTDRFEIRVHGNGLMRIDAPGSSISGVADLTFGAAWHSTNEHGFVPASAVVAYLSVPSGSRGTRGLAVSPSAFVPMSWTLPGGRGVAVMPGLSVVDEGSGFFATGTLAGALTQAIGERVVVFGEVAGESLRPSSRGGSVITAGVGGAVRVGLRQQLDVGVSRRVGASGPVARVYVGWSVRLRD